MKIQIGKKRFSLNIILFWIMIGPYLLPYYVNQLLTSNIARFIITYASMILMFLFAVKNYRYLKPSLLLVVLLYVTMIASTVMNRAEIFSSITESVKVILICATVSVVIERKDLTWNFIRAVKYYTLFFWIIHIIIMILHPNGIPAISAGKKVGYYLYGNVNTTIKSIFPGMCCSAMIDTKKKKMTGGTLLFLAGTLYQFFVIYHSATMIAATVFVVLWFLLRDYLRPKIKLVYLVILIVVLFLEVSIVILSSTGVMAFVANIFNKSTDMSGRTALWQRILYYISRKPVWGYGMQESSVFQSSIGNSNGSHNYYLDILYQGGIVGGSIFLLFILLPLVRIRKSSCVTSYTYIVMGYMCGYLLMFLMEPFNGCDFQYMPIMYSLIILTEGKHLSKKVRHRRRKTISGFRAPSRLYVQ